MRIDIDFPGFGTHTIDVHGLSQGGYQNCREALAQRINSKEKSRDVLADVFWELLVHCPEANPSDLWHHVVYREYLKAKLGTNPSQSWVRTSGEAFEIVIQRSYEKQFSQHGFRVQTLFSKKSKQQVLKRMGIWELVGSEKLDLVIEAQGRGVGIVEGYGIIGGIHAKVSLAERVSDDIPASRIMMEHKFASILCTLDVKSFPPPHGDLVNRGELGSSSRPSDKRKYIEEHGDFSVCLTYNHRTKTSLVKTQSGARIVRGLLGGNTNVIGPMCQFLVDNY